MWGQEFRLPPVHALRYAIGQLCQESPLIGPFSLARSPVFRAMFQNDMAERKNKKVDVVDLHPDVVAEMLQVSS